MKIPDVNLLVYAVNEGAPSHAEARTWIEESLSGPELIGFPWISISGFLRLITNTRLSPLALKPADALAIVDHWLSVSGARQIDSGPLHLQILGRLMVEHEITGRDVTDARLAAIAIEHDATFATFDSDFHRFADLKLEYLGAH